VHERDSGQDWEADPLIADGKPSTWEEFAEDASAGDSGCAPPQLGPYAGDPSVDENGIAVLDATGDEQGPVDR